MFRNTEGISPLCLKSLPSMLGQFASTFCSVPSSLTTKSHKRKLTKRVATRTSLTLFRDYLSSLIVVGESCRDLTHLCSRGLDTEVGGKGSQLSGGQKRGLGYVSILCQLPTNYDLFIRTNCHCPCPVEEPQGSSAG